MGYYDPENPDKKGVTKRDKERYMIHVKKIKKAERVLNRLRSFAGKYRIAQIMIYLKKIDPFVFQELALNQLEVMGYRIRRSRRYTGDLGGDGRVFDTEGNLICVQTKCFTGYVKAKHIEEFKKLIEKQEAVKGLFIHTGKTGRETYRKYKNSKIEIISGQKLVDMVLGKERAGEFVEKRRL